MTFAALVCMQQKCRMLAVRLLFVNWIHCQVLAVLLLVSMANAFAYRPFDSTDADVAPAGEFELELGPWGRLREASKHFLVAPAVVANFGLSGDRELVIQGNREVALNRDPGEPHSALVDNGVFIKQVLKRGVLQDESGPSVATEYGLLLPSTHGDNKTGVSVAGIVSYRWQEATVHFNGALALNRDHEPELFMGAILEGPHSWAVRPVAEVFADQARGSRRTTSGLIGAIWRVRDGLSFDAGFRSGHEGGEPVREVRLGLTWAFELGKRD